MSKLKIAFYCQNCGASFSKWQGKCSACNQWNTIVEEVVRKDASSSNFKTLGITDRNRQETPVSIQDISVTSEIRFPFDSSEFDRVLGGGVVPGSVTLLAGEPGVGKSTLALQIALSAPFRTLYVSGEESQRQIKMRAERLGRFSDDCYVLTETQLQNIFLQMESLRPDAIVIDSIQTLHTEIIDAPAGSVSQIKQCAADLIKVAKNTQIPILLIGHITKEGAIAGPKVLEHMVDTVLQFEGDRNHVYRVLRSTKNRFGSVSELGIFEMSPSGLQPIINPSQILLSRRLESLSGISVGATMEGIRVFLIEVQALVSSAVYGTPQRSTTGFNAKRLNMLLAVLEKKAGFKLATKDVFLNITGGITIDDPALDLSVIMSILSSAEDIPILKDTCFIGEIGLAGEVRPVNKPLQRISEAAKLGFKTFFLSKYSQLSERPKDIKICQVATIEEVIRSVFA